MAWRWSHARPRVAMSFALPSPFSLPGILTLDGLWERQSYEAATSPDGREILFHSLRLGNRDLTIQDVYDVQLQLTYEVDTPVPKLATDLLAFNFSVFLPITISYLDIPTADSPRFLKIVRP